MDHPNIAKVFDAGATETGRPFFVMELVRGTKITEFCDASRLSTSERLKLFVQVCQAIQHAHQKGVIHRDIKPSNILVTLRDGVPVPKVIDFGIAKATADQRLTDKTVFTAFEQFIGTPAYMSPEQAEMSELGIDTRSDIYSLGVLLYELLTGATPFDARKIYQAGLDEMRRIIREEEPVQPSTRLTTSADLAAIAACRNEEPARLARLIRGELDWIVMKALEKDRQRRYETAYGLGRDVERHLANEPVVARPSGNFYRFQKLVRRNKLAFGAVSAVFIALVIGLGVSLWEFAQKSRAEGEQVRLREEAEAAKAAEAGLRQEAERQELAARRTAYASDMNLVQQALAAYDLSRAQELLDRHRPLLGQPDLRGWEWRYLWQFCQNDATATFCQPTNGISAVTFSRDGKFLALGSANEVTVWDVATRQMIYRHPLSERVESRLAFAPSADLLAFYDAGNVVLWDSRSRQETRQLALGGALRDLAFTRDERLFTTRAEGQHDIAVWNTETGDRVTNYPATFSRLRIGRLFDASPDGRHYAYVPGTSPDSVKLVDIGTNNSSWTFRAADEYVTFLAFSPDGRYLATGAGYVESTIKIWDVTNHQLAKTLEGHRSWIGYLKFLPDSKTLISESSDQTIRLWDVESSRPIKTIRCPLKDKGTDGKGIEGKGLDLSADGRYLASGGDRRVLWWDLAAPESVPPTYYQITNATKIGPRRVRSWGFSPDSARLALVDDGIVKLFDAATLKLNSSPAMGVTNVTAVDFSPDNQMMAATTGEGRLAVWDVPGRRLITNLLAHAGEARLSKPAFDANSRRILTLGDDGYERVWNVNGWQQEAQRQLDVDVSAFAFSPGGNVSVTINKDGGLDLMDWGNPARRRRGLGSREMVSLSFSPDGRLLAGASEKGILELFDVDSLRSLAKLRAVLLGLHSTCFSPDGQRLATGGDGEEAMKLWDVNSRQVVTTLRGQGSLFYNAAWSPDGNTIGARNLKGVLHLWRAPSWEEIAAKEAAK